MTRPPGPSTRSRRLLGAVAVCGAALVGCTATDPGDAQPAPNASEFVTGGFDELPRLQGDEPIGPRSEDGDVVTQSFRAEGLEPEDVMSFYEEELTGWEPSGVRDVGEALRQEFDGPDGQRLEVSATVLSQGGLDMTQTLQYSLVLYQ